MRNYKNIWFKKIWFIFSLLVLSFLGQKDFLGQYIIGGKENWMTRLYVARGSVHTGILVGKQWKVFICVVEKHSNQRRIVIFGWVLIPAKCYFPQDLFIAFHNIVHIHIHWSNRRGLCYLFLRLSLFLGKGRLRPLQGNPNTMVRWGIGA